MKVSRRKLFQVALPAAAVAGTELAAQAPVVAADADLDNARQALRVSAQITRQVSLPMTVEPATKFVPRS
jgi:hypothetical protein